MQVAVRVRVFSEREKASKASLVIRMTREMQGSKTFVTHPETKDEREFKFDYSFNSHKDDPSVGPFAAQDSVFEDFANRDSEPAASDAAIADASAAVRFAADPILARLRG